MAIKFEQLPNPIEAGQIIRAGHVSQSLVAFSGLDAYDINLSGSFAMTGSIYHIEIDDAAGVASSVLVRDNTTGEYYTTGSYGGGGGTAGSSGSSGTSGAAGSSGSSGTSGIAGSSGSSGTSGSSGSSGTSGVGVDGSSGSSGTSGVGADGSSGSSGTSGIAGSSGSSGTSGIAGSSGSSGTSGDSGSSGSSGTSGDSGSSGSSGTSGVGTDGSSGSSGTSGAAGSSGSSGTSGAAGSSGSSGTSGAAGSSGSSGTSGLLSNQPMYDVSSSSGSGTLVPFKFIAGSTVITSGTTSRRVDLTPIANLTLGQGVHITATAVGNETLSSANITVTNGSVNTLPASISSTGTILFYSDVTAPTDGIFVMYHIMYTEAFPG